MGYYCCYDVAAGVGVGIGGGGRRQGGREGRKGIWEGVWLGWHRSCYRGMVGLVLVLMRVVVSVCLLDVSIYLRTIEMLSCRFGDVRRLREMIRVRIQKSWKLSNMQATPIHPKGSISPSFQKSQTIKGSLTTLFPPSLYSLTISLPGDRYVTTL